MRGVATRAVTGTAAKAAINSTGGRVAASAAGQFGVNALQRPKPVRQDKGITQHIRENPGEALAGGAMAMMRYNTISDNAMNDVNGLLQSTQFRSGA